MATTKKPEDFTTFKIHPAIGIARLGDSETEIVLTPERWRGLPIDASSDGTPVLDSAGNEQPTNQMRDAQGRIKRAGARFRVFAYPPGQPAAEVKIGQVLDVLQEKSGQVITGMVLDIEFQVYLANKKAGWYTFQELDGEHGYGPGHARRNADVPAENRQGLIVDPGPIALAWGKDTDRHQRSFARGQNPDFPQQYPPPGTPYTVDSLGDVLVTRQDGYQRLVVLGGHGHAGSTKSGIGEPKITSFVNNDGWFDDVADGPVGATLTLAVQAVDGQPPIVPNQKVKVPAHAKSWVIVGYPRYAPQISDMVTLDEAVFDVAVRNYAYAPEIFGVAPYTRAANDPKTPSELRTWRLNARYNPNYVPRFWAQIWPILLRPNVFQWVMSFDGFFGGDPHNTGPGGNLDQAAMSQPPQAGKDPYLPARSFIESVMRKPGGENQYVIPTQSLVNKLIYMPLLCGDNPISNTAASKFLRLTDTMLFLLKQWAQGKFVDEKKEPSLAPPPLGAGEALDRGVLSNGLGGAFCPGGEVSWVIRNPAIYTSGFRIRHAEAPSPGSLSQNSDFAAGLEPGDLTKYAGVPWHADFHECSTQSIDVTYAAWNQIEPASIGDPVPPAIVNPVYWWPSHRPMTVFASADGPQIPWAGTMPDTYAGDLMMVEAWKNLGFILNDSLTDPDQSPYYQQQRNNPLT